MCFSVDAFFDNTLFAYETPPLAPFRLGLGPPCVLSLGNSFIDVEVCHSRPAWCGVCFLELRMLDYSSFRASADATVCPQFSAEGS